MQELFGDENFFSKYFENYFDACLNHEDPLSENNNVVKALESITDYILMGSSLKTKPDKIPTEESNDNYYKSNDQKIYERDYKDPDLAPLLDYRNLKNHIKDLKTNGIKGRVNYDRLTGEINKDMIVVKNSIKKPVILTSCSRAVEPVHWDEADYYSFEHMRQLILIDRGSFNSDLGLISEDVRNMIKVANLTDREREILSFMRRGNVSQAEAALEFGCSETNIGKILNNITKKIVDYNFDHAKYIN